MGSETRSTRSKTYKKELEETYKKELEETYKKELEEYDHRFVEMEFRALRAYLMNYGESAYFDWWSATMVMLSTCVFVAAILGGSYYLYQKELETAGTILASFLPTSGVLRWLATGKNDFLPSLDARAQKHVNAGAEMTRIHRLAELYRSQLHTGAPAPTDSTRWEAQYKELLSAYKEGSSYSVIREKAYQKYNPVELICTEQRKRKDQVTNYLAEKAKNQENKDTNNKTSKETQIQT